MTDPEVLDAGPTRSSRQSVVVVVGVVAVAVALMLVWSGPGGTQPTPAPSSLSAPVSAAPTDPLKAGAIFIQTAVLGPEGSDSGIFDLYRDHQLLDSGWVVEQSHLKFTFQGARGRFVITGSHLAVHRLVHYLDWAWSEGTGDYASLAGSGKAEFIAPDLDRYGVLGRLSGTIRRAPSADQTRSRR
jgi:hypothetical protein